MRIRSWGPRGVAPAALMLVAALAAAAALWLLSRPQPVKLDAEFHAVLLAGGQVYFGRLEGLGTRFPVLRDVHYVQSQVNPETKAVSNILVRRGKEWHGPDRMYLNADQIVLVEPVSSSSRVAQLIRENR